MEIEMPMTAVTVGAPVLQAARFQVAIAEGAYLNSPVSGVSSTGNLSAVDDTTGSVLPPTAAKFNVGTWSIERNGPPAGM
jgi:hypothetical protein